MRGLLPSLHASWRLAFADYEKTLGIHYVLFLKHQTFSLRSNDCKSSRLERTVLRPVPNSSKIQLITDAAGCCQIGYAASAKAFFGCCNASVLAMKNIY